MPRRRHIRPRNLRDKRVVAAARSQVKRARRRVEIRRPIEAPRHDEIVRSVRRDPIAMVDNRAAHRECGEIPARVIQPQDIRIEVPGRRQRIRAATGIKVRRAREAARDDHVFVAVQGDAPAIVCRRVAHRDRPVIDPRRIQRQDKHVRASRRGDGIAAAAGVEVGRSIKFAGGEDISSAVRHDSKALVVRRATDLLGPDIVAVLIEFRYEDIEAGRTRRGEEVGARPGIKVYIGAPESARAQHIARRVQRNGQRFVPSSRAPLLHPRKITIAVQLQHERVRATRGSEARRSRPQIKVERT